jgi:hypothetical protein
MALRPGRCLNTDRAKKQFGFTAKSDFPEGAYAERLIGTRRLGRQFVVRLSRTGSRFEVRG